jgi:hypothetical protein
MTFNENKHKYDEEEDVSTGTSKNRRTFDAYNNDDGDDDSSSSEEEEVSFVEETAR